MKIIKILIVMLILLTTACGSNKINDRLINTKVINVNADAYIEQVAEVNGNGEIIKSTEDISNPSTVPDNRKKDAQKSTYNQSNKIDTSNDSHSVSKPDEQMINVDLTIDCKTILNNMDDLKEGYESFIPQQGIILDPITVEVKKNSTVLDVLKKANEKYNLDLKTRGSSFGTYIIEIKSIGEKICGNSSGWMYSVNNGFPGQSASSYRLKDGDKIKWRFTCQPGDLN